MTDAALPASRGLWRRPAVSAGLAGAGAALGHAPFGLPYATLAAFAVLVVLVIGADGPRRAAILGWAFGFGHFLVALHWIVEPFMVDPLRHGWMAPFVLILLPAGLALFWAAPAALAVRLSGGRRWTVALGLAGWLALAEWLRGRVLTGFPWATPGQVWAEGPALPLAGFAGAVGLTVLTLALAAIPAAAARRRPAYGVIAAGALALPVMGAGLAMPPAPDAGDGAATVRLIQPNAAQDQKWNPDLFMDFFWRQISFTEAPGAPDVTVWPETAIPWFLEAAAPALERMAEASEGRPVIVGLRRADEADRLYNSLAVLGRDGAPEAVYDKHHLVPFGEYVPLRSLAARLGIAGLAAGGGGFFPGEGPSVIAVPGLGRVLPLICYEAVFPRNVRGVTERPDVLLQITNDAWFGRFAGPQQHLAQARLRAAEFGLPLIRVANTGISAVIDARGAPRGAVLPLGQAGFADIAVPTALPPTLYARMGDLPWLLLALVLAVGPLAAARGRTV